MPKFEIVSKDEAMKRTAFTGKRGEIMSLYLFFIEELKEGQAGRLRPSENETAQAIRRRLGAAAKVAGKRLAIKRIGDEIYFWIDSGKSARAKRVVSRSDSSNESYNHQ